MTERRTSYLHVLATQDKQSSLEASTCLSLGQVDDPDFQAGYEHGMQQYEQWHRDDLMIDEGLLLSLLRNGWGSSRYSDMWQTGYITGWLFALFAQATGITTANLIFIQGEG